ncbi:unnamed protein product [Spirodela intermedia]|uniref:Uncharacterized protein n=1 Tax=Spirodela intermedia TaxID=51605 RepID=A0A7I8J801_SPIIN|nr:unnamed protein product [Spirodela intermedia]CAA6666191.1 unnamed protein product [Spirodela intermedia]
MRTVSYSSTSSSGGAGAGGLRPWIIIMLLSIVATIFLHSWLPSSAISLRPNFVKNGWDALNVVLVVFAVVCGFLKPSVSTSHVHGDWLDSSYRDAGMEWGPKRSKNLYTDLTQDRNSAAGDGRTFSGDVSLHGDSASEKVAAGEDEGSVSTSPPPPRRSNRMLPKEDRLLAPSTLPQGRNPRRLLDKEMGEKSTFKCHQESEMSPSRPPPLPQPPSHREEQSRAHKRRSGGAKDIAASLGQFYQKKKRSSSKGEMSNDSYISFPQASHRRRRRRLQRESLLCPGAGTSPPPRPSRNPSSGASVPPEAKESLHRSGSFFFSLPPQPPAQPPPPPPPPPPPAEKVAPRRKGQCPPFCPSPDVNSKAEAFIANLRAGWQLEKLNSVEEKQRRRRQPQPSSSS